MDWGDEEEESNHSTSISRISPLFHVPGQVQNERDQQIRRCFTVNNASSYIWGQDTPEFRPLLSSVPIVQISCGAQHVAFLTAVGQVYTFGGNEVFQCGLGKDSHPFIESPTLVTSLVQTNVSSLVCGPSQTAAIISNKEFYTWGLDASTQTRVHSPQLFRHWSKIGEGKVLEQLHFGPQHVSLLIQTEKETTEVWCWGASNRGMLGLSQESRNTLKPSNLTPRGGQKSDIKRHPVLMVTLFGQKIVQLAGSETHMCALSDDGEVFAWGQNLEGCLGVGSSQYIVGAPLPVRGLTRTTAVQVACGDNFTTIVTDCDEVYSWGLNEKGQLGLGTTEKTLKPTLVPISEDDEICLVLCGNSHACALTKERKALLWGSGGDYQINPVSVDDALEPTELAANPIGIALGSNFTVSLFGELDKVMEIPKLGEANDETKKAVLPDLRVASNFAKTAASLPKGPETTSQTEKEGESTTTNTLEVLQSIAAVKSEPLCFTPKNKIKDIEQEPTSSPLQRQSLPKVPSQPLSTTTQPQTTTTQPHPVLSVTSPPVPPTIPRARSPPPVTKSVSLSPRHILQHISPTNPLDTGVSLQSSQSPPSVVKLPAALPSPPRSPSLIVKPQGLALTPPRSPPRSSPSITKPPAPSLSRTPPPIANLPDPSLPRTPPQSSPLITKPPDPSLPRTPPSIAKLPDPSLPRTPPQSSPLITKPPDPSLPRTPPSTAKLPNPSQPRSPLLVNKPPVLSPPPVAPIPSKNPIRSTTSVPLPLSSRPVPSALPSSLPNPIQISPRKPGLSVPTARHSASFSETPQTVPLPIEITSQSFSAPGNNLPEDTRGRSQTASVKSPRTQLPVLQSHQPHNVLPLPLKNLNSLDPNSARTRAQTALSPRSCVPPPLTPLQTPPPPQLLPLPQQPPLPQQLPQPPVPEQPPLPQPLPTQPLPFRLPSHLKPSPSAEASPLSQQSAPVKRVTRPQSTIDHRSIFNKSSQPVRRGVPPSIPALAPAPLTAPLPPEQKQAPPVNKLVAKAKPQLARNTSIILPAQVMAETTPLQIRVKVSRVEGRNGTDLVVMLTQNKERSPDSRSFKTSPSSSSSSSVLVWDSMFNLTITKQHANWYFFLLKKEDVLASFFLDVSSLKTLLANQPTEIKLEDGESSLFIVMTTINWAPAQFFSTPRSSREPAHEPIKQVRSDRPPTVMTIPILEPGSQTLRKSDGATSPQSAKRKEKQQEKKNRRKTLSTKFPSLGMGKIKHDTNEMGFEREISERDNSHSSHSSHTSHTSHSSHISHKHKKAGKVPVEGIYVVDVRSPSGVWLGCVRTLSSGRFLVSKEIKLDDLQNVDEEFLYQLTHFMAKKKGHDLCLGGLKNLKYDKYLSRPYVGEKLQATNILSTREAINIYDSEWLMYKEKMKDALPLSLSPQQILLVSNKGGTSSIHMNLISADEENDDKTTTKDLSGFQLTAASSIKRNTTFG